MNIKNFTRWGGQGGQAEGIIRLEKWENHKNSTHTKIQFYIISIKYFFSMMDIKIFTAGGGSGGWHGAGRGHSPFIKMRKSQEQYPY